MKKLFLLVISAALVAGTWSCEKTKKEDATLELDPSTDIVFDVEGETMKVKVTTNQDVWDAQSDQTWCEVTKGTGEFTLTVKANESEEAMPQAVITVTAGEGDNTITKTIKADQPGAETPVIPAELTLDPEEDIVFEAKGGDMKITVTTNQEIWDVQSDQTWCVVEKGEGEFTVTAAVNKLLEAMPQATITVTAGEGNNIATKTLKVDQKAAELPNMKFPTANLYYFEQRSWENAGYYMLQMGKDIQQGVYQALNIAFYHDVITPENKADLNKIPVGTYTITSTGEVGKFNVNPGKGELMSSQDGTYCITIHGGMPESLYLMNGGTMTVSEENGGYMVVIDFEGVDSETGEEIGYQAYFQGKPMYTYIQAAKEMYTTTFTKVKEARIINLWNSKSYMFVLTLTDDSDLKEIRLSGYLPLDSSALAEGSYTFDLDVPAAMDPFTLMGGSYSPQYGLGGTYYQEADGTYITVAIPATGKTMTVSYDGTNYSIMCDFEGLNERNARKEAAVKATYNGPIEFQVM